MSTAAVHSDTRADSRTALDTLASMPLDELRRLAARLDDEARIVRGILRERSRRPAARPQPLSIIGGPG
ncbi:MAG TPA: hypothetical protein VMG10_27440 [Gemmataceae bacterium]|nr:hypothetical protein [Gemmataceae bacterium]